MAAGSSLRRLQSLAKVRKLLKQGLLLGATGQLRGLSKEDPPLDFTDLSYRVGTELARLYARVENELRCELCPHRAKDSEVITALWELFCEVASDPTGFTPTPRLAQRARRFGDLWPANLITFDVAYSITYLDLGSSHIKVGEVTFSSPDEATIGDWGFDRPPFEWSRAVSRTGPMSLACIQVEAADASLSYETGLQPVLEALDVIRLAGLRGTENRLPYDYRFRWELGGLWAARARHDPSVKTVGWQRPSKPLVVNLSQQVEESLSTDGLGHLLDTELHDDIQQRLLRAAHWVSHSATHDGDDYKIVDLCTALETMLLPGYDGGRKGLLIAIRYNLIGGSLNPAAVKWFYDLRSNMVHGSALKMASGLDTWHLRLVCHTVLSTLIELAMKNPEIEKLEQLIASQETSEKLKQFIRRCQRGTYEGTGIRKMREFAELRLKYLEKLTSSPA